MANILDFSEFMLYYLGLNLILVISNIPRRNKLVCDNFLQTYDIKFIVLCLNFFNN
ncbi:unnamed protein product [marine sediment metagenome]|uniref:Uncharacterized protein n=1 Tax=marine sediment metagenome TaxID=412755 RepID=X1A4P0_9ZZZZ